MMILGGTVVCDEAHSLDRAKLKIWGQLLRLLGKRPPKRTSLSSPARPRLVWCTSDVV